MLNQPDPDKTTIARNISVDSRTHAALLWVCNLTGNENYSAAVRYVVTDWLRANPEREEDFRRFVLEQRLSAFYVYEASNKRAKVAVDDVAGKLGASRDDVQRVFDKYGIPVGDDGRVVGLRLRE